MASIILAAAGTAIGGSIGGAVLGVSAATIGGAVGSLAGAAIDSWLVASMAPTQKIAGQRLDTLQITASTEGAVIPRVYGRMRDGRQHHLGDRLPRGDRDHPPWRRRQGRRRWRRHRGHRVLLLRQPRGRALRGPDHRRRAHLGRRQADEPRRRDHARPSRRRGPGRRSLHRGEDGRGEHARLSRHGLCRLRGAAARALRQPDAAALLRGVPPDPRRRVGREPGARRHADPGLGRVRLRDRGGAPRGRRDHVARRTSTPRRMPPTSWWRSTGCRPARRRWSRSRSWSPGSATTCAPGTAASARASRSARRRRRRRTGR